MAKESVRDIYLTDDPADAATLLDKAIVACLDDDVAEIQSLGRTLARWRTEILNWPSFRQVGGLKLPAMAHLCHKTEAQVAELCRDERQTLPQNGRPARGAKVYK